MSVYSQGMVQYHAIRSARQGASHKFIFGPLLVNQDTDSSLTNATPCDISASQVAQNNEAQRRAAIAMYRAYGSRWREFSLTFHLHKAPTNAFTPSIISITRLNMANIYGHRQYQQIPDQYNLKPVDYAQKNS